MNNIEEMKKEFEEKFIHANLVYSGLRADATISEVWNFIEQKLTQQREEVLNKILSVEVGENLGLGKLSGDERVAISAFKDYIKHLTQQSLDKGDKDANNN